MRVDKLYLFKKLLEKYPGVTPVKPEFEAKVIALLKSLPTLGSGISVALRLLIFSKFSRGYSLIKGGYAYQSCMNIFIMTSQ